MKIGSVGTELFHTDDRTDTTKLRVAFRNFAKSIQNVPANKTLFLMPLVYVYSGRASNFPIKLTSNHIKVQLDEFSRLSICQHKTGHGEQPPSLPQISLSVQ
jgi:hypothetical protein